MANILRTSCVVPFTTPSGSITNLPINCAATDSNSWNWKYFWVKTQGITTTQGFNRSDTYATLPSNPEILINGSGGFQLVIRGMFAYVATHSVNISVNINSSVVIPYVDKSSVWASMQQYAKLFSPSGGNPLRVDLDQTIVFTSSNNDIASIPQFMNNDFITTLPATNCPLVYFVWIRGVAAGVPNPWMDKTIFNGTIAVSLESTV